MRTKIVEKGHKTVKKLRLKQGAKYILKYLSLCHTQIDSYLWSISPFLLSARFPVITLIILFKIMW